MRPLIIVFVLLMGSRLAAQPCDCASQLRYTIRYFEDNNPAFQKVKASPAEYARYRAEADKLEKAAGAETDADRCILYMDRYAILLKDHHSDIGFNLQRKELGTPELIQQFKESAEYRQFKKITIDTAAVIAMLKSKRPDEVEGIYINGGLVVGISRNEGSPNDYTGVALKRTRLFDAGHVLLELSRQPDSSFDITYYTGLLGFTTEKVIKNNRIEQGNIPSLGFVKSAGTASAQKEYAFLVLDPSTNYLRLHSFDGELTEELNMFYEEIDSQLQSRPFLIIDLRDNAGGSEASYVNLLPYAYTQPMQIDSAEVWVSPDNIRHYEELGDKHKELVRRMKEATPFTFISESLGGSYTWEQDSGTVYPKKIALLFDRGSASAAEGMIYYFRQSSKVITMGENSGGYIGYGNVMTTVMPCGKFTIRSTVTKYSRKSVYEFAGIPPEYRLSKDQDWVKEARKLLEAVK